MAKIVISFIAILSIGLALSSEDSASFLSEESQFVNLDNAHLECPRRTPKTPTGDSKYIRYAVPFQLKHVSTQKMLHSHFFNNLKGSQQQQVTGFDIDNIGNDWIAKAKNSADCFAPSGDRVLVGDVIRLESLRTRGNLHAEPGAKSAVSNLGEVSVFGFAGIGDDNDDWVVEVAGKKTGDFWEVTDKVKLIHKTQGCALHSHPTNYPEAATGQQEVLCYNLRDDNDLWIVSYNP